MGTACATHKKCTIVASGKSQASPRDPAVKTTSPTEPQNDRAGKCVSSIVWGASGSEAVVGRCIKADYLANDFQVSITLSGLSEIELMPSSANQCAKSG